MSRDQATEAQVIAADPRRSTWVSANAGSGKTRVLTDRVARLLLNEVPPQRILCLTYTNAAAAHMQNKLFERLGGWAMLPDAALKAALSDLGEDVGRLDSPFLRRARTLFARALETPGGLKIQTIHAFCASVLRRFPLEAGVSPAFVEMDERSGKNLRADIVEQMAQGADTSTFDDLARHLTQSNLDGLLAQIGSKRDAFAKPPPDKGELWRRCGLPESYDEAAYLRETLPDWLGDFLAEVIEALNTGSSNDVKLAARLAALDFTAPLMQTARRLETLFVYGEKVREDRVNRAKTDSIPTGAGGVAGRHPDLVAALHEVMESFERTKPRRQALVTAERALALHRFAHDFLQRYERAKARRGWLDFDDLILKTRDLLSEPATAQWVLFRLDGGIDHILVDEAQDTNPDQWQVIAHLAEEFFAGKGAREVARTLFAVGDRKQSIFSFQGADPARFDAMAEHFGDRLLQIGDGLGRRDLLYSFRSASAVLDLVDTLFAARPEAGMDGITHRAFHHRMPGRVDLWPCLEPAGQPEPSEWFHPVDRPEPSSPALQLARQVASAISAMLERGEWLPRQQGARPLRPGDFLILVQRRSTLFHEIIRALKEADLPVAGADRLRIGGELAVRDLLALLAFLATPEDDLSLACVLRSPIGGLSEADLHALAHDRRGALWPELRGAAARFGPLVEMLQDLLDRVDFLRPFELLERILTRHGGRDRLIARLGREAEEGIDALLSQALVFEQAEAPSLTGFLVWMEGDESDIRRQIDPESDQIRVMTVHGAKGLEAPVVILPDTVSEGRGNAPEILAGPDGTPFWATSGKDDFDPALRQLTGAAESFYRQERQRLLYVALTRAENWLIVCGAGKRSKAGGSWYDQIESAMAGLCAEQIDWNGMPIQRYAPLPWPEGGDADATQPPAAAADPPVWLNAPAPPPRPRPPVIAPSALGGAKTLTDGAEGHDDANALLRGTAVHLLLQHLPDCPPDQRPPLAREMLANAGHSPDDPALEGVIDEALALVTDPALAAVFAPDTLAEVALAAPLGEGVIEGAIDRLVVAPDRVLAIDFKTNALVPDTPAETPEGILRQMGAYAHALSAIYPGRRIETAILWTRTGQLMPLPAALVTDALSRATAP